MAPPCASYHPQLSVLTQATRASTGLEAPSSDGNHELHGTSGLLKEEHRASTPPALLAQLPGAKGICFS